VTHPSATARGLFHRREGNIPLVASETLNSQLSSRATNGTQLASCVERINQMQRPSMSTTRRPVVLLVQQSRDDGLEMYAEFLRYHGLAVIPVSHARDALMLAPQADIVVTGMNLDDPMDGVELVSRLRKDDGTKFMPIIVLTACTYPKDRERAEGAGCDVFLPKPCLPNDLLGEVRQLLAATRSQTAGTPHVFQLPSHRTARHAHG
jgi:two-component system, cell cycle response regulator DivK